VNFRGWPAQVLDSAQKELQLRPLLVLLTLTVGKIAARFRRSISLVGPPTPNCGFIQVLYDLPAAAVINWCHSYCAIGKYLTYLVPSGPGAVHDEVIPSFWSFADCEILPASNQPAGHSHITNPFILLLGIAQYGV